MKDLNSPDANYPPVITNAVEKGTGSVKLTEEQASQSVKTLAALRSDLGSTGLYQISLALGIEFLTLSSSAENNAKGFISAFCLAGVINGARGIVKGIKGKSFIEQVEEYQDDRRANKPGS